LNYDLVLEQAVLQLVKGDAFRYGEADPPTVEVLKLHGSFPDTDRHLRAVLKSAVNAGKLRRVVVCVKEDAGAIDRLKKVVSGMSGIVEVCEEDGGLDALVESDKVAWLMQTGVQ
jgi:hypothetical protein